MPAPPRRNLRNLVYCLCSQDFCLVCCLVAGIHARAYLRRLITRRGALEPMRLLLIYSIVFPLVLLVYRPSPCNPSPDLLGAWSWSLMACLSFYHLLP